MGEDEGEIPCLDFTGKDLISYLDEKSEAWKELSNRVRKACEVHGCFLVKFEGSNLLPLQLRQAFFTAMETLFDLPLETKQKYSGNVRPFSLYDCSSATRSEYFGIDEANRLQVARDFTTLMWPDHHDPTFSEVLNSMSSKMLEMCWIFLKMVFKSFNIANCNELLEKNCTSHFRLMKYDTPASSNGPIAVGLIPHTDKNFLTILCENDVQGLEIQSKDGEKWSEVIMPNQSFIVFLGYSLKAWSNGKFHAVKHRVIMRGEKVRYSSALFLSPKDNATVEVSQRFVDEHHLLLYRPYTYSKFLTFYTSSNFIDGALELFAGV